VFALGPQLADGVKREGGILQRNYRLQRVGEAWAERLLGHGWRVDVPAVLVLDIQHSSLLPAELSSALDELASVAHVQSCLFGCCSCAGAELPLLLASSGFKLLSCSPPVDFYPGAEAGVLLFSAVKVRLAEHHRQSVVRNFERLEAEASEDGWVD
jgi:hypothetical protein